MSDVLVIAAHPDDEVLGCGGSIARMSAEGRSVVVAILGEGGTSRHPAGSAEGAAEVAALKQCSREAARILGVRELVFCGLADNRFDAMDLLDIVKVVENLAGRFDPELVLVQHGGDLNRDHELTFRAAMTAFRPLPGTRVRELRAFEVASSSEWAFGKFSPAFAPDTYVDVSDFLAAKLDALRSYDNEIRAFPHPRSLRGVEAQALDRGVRVGVAAAEAFQTIWRRL
jgi:LmbE family N-acetylglucosaminyl deacetylase